MMEYEDALRAYWEHFGERFPTEGMGSEAKIARIIEGCLERDEPFEPEDERDGWKAVI